MIRRRARDEDIMECLSVDPARIGEEVAGYERAIDAWKALMRSPSFRPTVIETDPPIQSHRIVAFGASVFVSRAFADEELLNPRPGLNARIIASVASTEPIVLNRDQLRDANTQGGLDVVVLCPQWRKGILTAAQVSEVQMLLAAGFLQEHRGFRLHRLISEVMNEEERVTYAEAGAWRIVNDFREFYAAHPETFWNKGRSLGVITRDEAFAVPGHITAMLFQYQEPVLGFREADQEFLSAALTGQTDEELARNLNRRLPTIKKHWRSLFERVSTHPDLFPEICDGIEDAGRGRQKRQFILTYVREHPEELRPFKHTR